MSNLVQLIELFPDVSIEFLNGICDVDDEDVTIEELVEIVLSFEFPPLRENGDVHSSDANCFTSDGPVDIKSEGPSIIKVSETYQSRESEVLTELIPEIIEVLPSECSKSLSEQSCNFNKLGDGENSISQVITNEFICDATQVMNDSFEDGSETEVEPTQVINDSCEDDSTINKLFSEIDNRAFITNHQQLKEEEEEDDLPECSIKYLMEEKGFIERYNITTYVKELGTETSEENSVGADLSNLTNGSSNLTKETSSNLASSNGKSLAYHKLKKAYRFRKRTMSDCANSAQAVPHCSTKRITLRSCKVKNEEERLRRRLINQNKLLYERKEKNTNSFLSSSQFLDIDKKYSLLCNIFTDASPTYLLSQCALLTDQEKILAFISQNLEFRDYPKIDTIRQEPELMETCHCTVAEFLDVIPDPIKEFSSTSYIRVGYEENAEIYLKARYEELGDEEVKELLISNNYNLTNVCYQLEGEGRTPILGVLDYTPLHHPASVFFHQEVWYIEHRKEVQDFLESAIEAMRIQEELNRPPPPPEEVFECEICREEIVEYKDLGTCDGKTGHLFCVNCIKRSVEVKIGDGSTSFPCLVNCGASIPLQTVEELLPKQVFDKLMGRIQEDEIRKANIAGVETCPFCPYAYGPGEETLFICLNPECMKSSCRICRKQDHSPDICEMFKNEDEERARLIIEDQMAEALMRTCHSCGKKFVKSGGCNKMECECGAKICYVCRQPVKDYTHFNGQGGDNIDRCPLFSEDAELHDRPVEATAVQVFNQIAANNPQLNLDRAKIIPK